MHTPYIEVLPPKQNSVTLDADLERFADTFNRVTASGYTACITDNAMGRLSFQATELIAELGLEAPDPAQVHIHLNTFHTREGLDEILDACAARGFRHLLVISGDGSEHFPKLRPDDLGDVIDVSGARSVTAATLLRYVRTRHPGFFTLGAAFNPYEPEGHEFEKLERKLEAGASFVVTQPVIGPHPLVDRLLAEYGVPVTLECWMSRKLHLLSDAVGYTIPEDTPYDPFACLAALRGHYPTCGLYLALVGFKTQWDAITEMFPRAGKARQGFRGAR